jgi:hypothetical protein
MSRRAAFGPSRIRPTTIRPTTAHDASAICVHAMGVRRSSMMQNRHHIRSVTIIHTNRKTAIMTSSGRKSTIIASSTVAKGALRLPLCRSFDEGSARPPALNGALLEVFGVVVVTLQAFEVSGLHPARVSHGLVALAGVAGVWLIVGSKRTAKSSVL